MSERRKENRGGIKEIKSWLCVRPCYISLKQQQKKKKPSSNKTSKVSRITYICPKLTK